MWILPHSSWGRGTPKGWWGRVRHGCLAGMTAAAVKSRRNAFALQATTNFSATPSLQ